MILNIIEDIGGNGASFLKSEFKTLQEVFAEALIFSAQKEQQEGLNNFMSVALKTISNFASIGSKFPFQPYLKHPVQFENLAQVLF